MRVRLHSLCNHFLQRTTRTRTRSRVQCEQTQDLVTRALTVLFFLTLNPFRKETNGQPPVHLRCFCVSFFLAFCLAFQYHCVMFPCPLEIHVSVVRSRSGIDAGWAVHHEHVSDPTNAYACEKILCVYLCLSLSVCVCWSVSFSICFSLSSSLSVSLSPFLPFHINIPKEGGSIEGRKGTRRNRVRLSWRD